MRVFLYSDEQAASVEAARQVAALVRRKPAAVLGLATGGTPLALYKELIRQHGQEGLDFSGCTTFNLDEYAGLAPSHPMSYHHYMRENFFEGVNLPAERTNIPDGLAEDIPAHCADYEAKIHSAGGVDLQILGLGSDGHIGFNEPTSSLGSRTRFQTLTENTRTDNARYFASLEEVPRHAITMGIATILEAREIILLAFGAAKAAAVASMIEGPLAAMVPASALQLHPAVRVFLDEGAASLLTKKDYYRYLQQQCAGQ